MIIELISIELLLKLKVSVSVQFSLVYQTYQCIKFQVIQ